MDSVCSYYFLLGHGHSRYPLSKTGLNVNFIGATSQSPVHKISSNFSLSHVFTYTHTHTHIFLSAPHPLLYMKGNKGAGRDVGEAVFTEKTPVADNDSLRAITWRRKVETK